MIKKRTLFNSGNVGLYDDYTDTNNLLFTLLLRNGLEYNFIFRSLKPVDGNMSLIEKKFLKLATLKYGEYLIHTELSRLSRYEYDMLQSLKTLNAMKLCES